MTLTGGAPIGAQGGSAITSVRADSFFGMGTLEAALAYLRIVKKPQSAAEIRQRMNEVARAGGFTDAPAAIKVMDKAWADLQRTMQAAAVGMEGFGKALVTYGVGVVAAWEAAMSSERERPGEPPLAYWHRMIQIRKSRQH